MCIVVINSSSQSNVLSHHTIIASIQLPASGVWCEFTTSGAWGPRGRATASTYTTVQTTSIERIEQTDAQQALLLLQVIGERPSSVSLYRTTDTE